MSWMIYLNPKEIEFLKSLKEKKNMAHTPTPNSMLFIVFNPGKTQDWDNPAENPDAYSVYTSPSDIPEGREVHVYERKRTGKIKPRELIFE